MCEVFESKGEFFPEKEPDGEELQSSEHLAVSMIDLVGAEIEVDA